MLRLLSMLLLAVALFAAPLGMRAGGEAMAHATAAEASSADDHCAEKQQNSDKPSKLKSSCVGMCSALPLTGSAGEAALPPKAVLAMRPLQPLGSIQPESETPPPRFS